LQVHYRRHRKADAPTLVMTNAWPMSIRCWDSTWDDLAHAFELLAFDMPGFGCSQGQAHLMRPSAQGAFLLKLLDHFAIERVHGVGPDVGVPAMLWLAEHHPERLHSIIIFNGPGFYPPHVSWELQALMRSKLLRTIVSRFGNGFASVAMRRGYRHFEPTADAKHAYRRFNGDAGRFRLTLEYLASYPTDLPAIGAQLDAIRCPVLILWGEHDPFLRIENAHGLVAKIPKRQFHPLANASHFAHEDADRIFVEAITHWCLGGFEHVDAT
jgi:pimeloyl-ACP methyl ester carboxylesterase